MKKHFLSFLLDSIFYGIAVFTFFVIITISTGCQSNYERVDSLRDDGTLEASWIEHRETGEKNGEYRLYSRDGMVVERSNYKKNELHGTRFLFDEEGRKIIEEHYRNGRLNGTYTAWFPDGGIRYTGNYEDNAMEGIWTYYYPSGAVKEKVNFADSETSGPFTEFYEDGTLKAKGKYIAGENEQDWLQLYDSTGTLNRLMLCNAGVCITYWTPDSGKAKLDQIWQEELQ